VVGDLRCAQPRFSLLDALYRDPAVTSRCE
jgi:hypothetical protein